MSEEISNTPHTSKVGHTAAHQVVEPKAQDRPNIDKHTIGFWQEVRKLVEDRTKITLRYIFQYSQILTIWTFALISDYILLLLLQWTLRDDITKYPNTIGHWFMYAKIGLGALTIIAAIVHGTVSTWSLIKLDLESPEDDRGQK